MRTLRRRVECVGCSLLVTLFAVSLAAQKPDQTASQFYLAYRAAFDRAKTIDELLPYLSSSRRRDFQVVLPAERGGALDLIKAFGTLTNVKVVSETRTEQGVTLAVEGIDPAKMKNTGKVDLVRESGGWKLDGENWTAAPPK